jgi:hypothetical protein
MSGYLKKEQQKSIKFSSNVPFKISLMKVSSDLKIFYRKISNFKKKMRQIVTASFAFIPPMSEWTTKNDPAKSTAEQEQGGVDEGLFGLGGDAFAAATDANKTDYIKSYFLPLTCSRQIFYVITPFVAMNDSFEAIEEEELEIYKLTPTLDFTLSLKLNFHGEKRKSTQMFSKHGLGNIRFLHELKVCGRVDASDFQEIAKLGFLKELDLSSVPNLPVESLKSLHGMYNLKKLNISLWSRLTEVGVNEIPFIAPNLEHLVLCNNQKRTKNFFDGLGKSESFCKSLKVFEIGELPRIGFKYYWYSNIPPVDDTVLDVISKFYNLRSLKISAKIGFSPVALRKMILSCERLCALELDASHGTFYYNPAQPHLWNLKHTKVLCKYAGERIESFSLKQFYAQWKRILYWVAKKMPGLRRLRLSSDVLEQEVRYVYEQDTERRSKGLPMKIPTRDANNFWCGDALEDFLEDIREKNIKFPDHFTKHNCQYWNNVHLIPDDEISTDCNSEFDEE